MENLGNLKFLMKSCNSTKQLAVSSTLLKGNSSHRVEVVLMPCDFLLFIRAVLRYGDKWHSKDRLLLIFW